MCYGISYACTVDCINTNLNTTRLADGVVTGMMPYNGCTIKCAEGVQWTDSWATTSHTPLPVDYLSIAGVPLNLGNMLLLLACILGLVALFLYLRRT
jgi:hypothetical protein